MREIKFKAFYREDKYWLTVTTLDFMKNADGSLPILCDGYKENGEHMHFGLHEVDLVQYTGLKDKNGKEIYEGDIVNIADIYDQVNFGGKRTYEKKEVEYQDFGWLPFITPGGIDCSFMYSDTDCEVIGNIYENPELIK